MTNLAINTNTWHYTYYRLIKRIYGGSIPEQTSLCPYVQTMIWGSIFVVAFSPAIALGWIVMKLFRLATTLEIPALDGFFNSFKQTKVMQFLDDGPEHFAESPFATGLFFLMMGITCLLFVLAAIAAVCIVLALVGVGVWNFKAVFAFLFQSLSSGLGWTGWAGFLGFYWIGFALNETWLANVWLFTNGELWHTIGSWVVWSLAWFAAITAASMALLGMGIAISKLPPVRALGRMLTSKINGWSDAQKKREERVTKRVKRVGPPWPCGYCGYNNNPAGREYCVECSTAHPVPPPSRILQMLGGLWHFCTWPFSSAKEMYVKVREKRIFVLGGALSVFAEYLWALKSGVCPMVSFVDANQLQCEAQASARERMACEAATANDDTSLGMELKDEIRATDRSESA